jgi:hypothetical protein
MRRVPASLTFFLAALLAVAACGTGSGGGGGGGGTATATPTGGVVDGGEVSATPSADTSGAPGSAAASGDSSGPSDAKQVPDDACSVITDTDIKELFGGDVEPVENDDDDDNSCSFSVTKAKGLNADYAADTPQIVSVTFDDGYIGYDEEHAAMGDAVDKVEGLGSEAWIGLGAIHVDLGDENELVLTTVFGEIYDPTVIEGERYALAKLVLSRL